MELRNWPWISSALLILWCFFEVQIVQASQVNRVVDGDTVVIENSDERIPIRLLYIDAPELRQHYGRNSKELLESLLKNCDLASQVESGRWKTDRFGRVLIDPKCNEEPLSNQMVREGAAWVYRIFKFPESLGILEDQARISKKGLWENGAAIRPWDWRKRKRGNNSRYSESIFDCSQERTCAEIRSCEEARYRLQNCGQTRLDRDSDGTPCEAICR